MTGEGVPGAAAQVLLLISDSSSWRFAGPAAYKQFQAICLKVGNGAARLSGGMHLNELCVLPNRNGGRGEGWIGQTGQIQILGVSGRAPGDSRQLSH